MEAVLSLRLGPAHHLGATCRSQRRLRNRCQGASIVGVPAQLCLLFFFFNSADLLWAGAAGTQVSATLVLLPMFIRSLLPHSAFCWWARAVSGLLGPCMR